MRANFSIPWKILFAMAACILHSAPWATAQQYSEQTSQDPPSRVARIAFVQGNVSLEPAGVDTFSVAELNYPLTTGDRIYVDNSSLSELQTGGLAVRMGNGADVTITSLTDSEAQFGLAQGSIRVRARDLYAPDGQQAVVEVDTPNGAILVQQPGDLRVDSYPQDDTTVVTITSGSAEITGQGLDQTLGANQTLRLSGSSPVYAEQVGLLPPDTLDRFALDRERAHQQSVSYRNQYVDPDMIGAADLDQYGDWQPSNDYGLVWYPRGVAVGWTPYSVGHWALVAPWGWTWVDAEPWGFAPFHYGRWNNFGGRWGWVPGPPPTVFRQAGFSGRPPRPVYSPALVAFVGGPNFSLSIGFGGGSGAGVTAWFPLGPREVYRPWYSTTPAYNNRVNVTNIYNTNLTEIHNTYINRTTNIYNTPNITNVSYVNREQATVAVEQRDFAAGRMVAQSQPIRLDEHTRQQLAQAPVLSHPLVTPARRIAAPQAPARALPPIAARPIVQTRQGFQRAGAPPSATPLRPPTSQPATSQPSRLGTNPGGTQPGNQLGNQPGSQPTNRAGFPQQRPTQATPPAALTPPSNQPVRPGQNAPVQNPALSGGRPVPPAAAQPRPLAPAPGASYGARPPNPPARPLQVPQPAPATGTTTPATYGVRPAIPPDRQTPAAAQPTIRPGDTAPATYGVRPANAPTAPAVPSRQTARPGQSAPAATAAPLRPAPPTQPQQPLQPLQPRPTPQPLEQQRPPGNVTPPPAQPTSDQQRRAIQQADPGRPLAPQQQLNNLRSGRPAGPAIQPGPAHSAPAPKGKAPAPVPPAPDNKVRTPNKENG